MAGGGQQQMIQIASSTFSHPPPPPLSLLSYISTNSIHHNDQLFIITQLIPCIYPISHQSFHPRSFFRQIRIHYIKWSIYVCILHAHAVAQYTSQWPDLCLIASRTTVMQRRHRSVYGHYIAGVVCPNGWSSPWVETGCRLFYRR